MKKWLSTFFSSAVALLMTELMPSGCVDSFGDINSVPLDFAIPPALSADPDGDGTGRPDLIVTRVPRLAIVIDE